MQMLTHTRAIIVSVLEYLQDLGVEILHLRDDQTATPFESGDAVVFDGFEIMEENGVDGDTKPAVQNDDGDVRVFVPFTESGNLIHASPERFLAKTDRTLPEGLCGGPTFDATGAVCGIVEGIVPVDHKIKDIAGAASFIPSFAVRSFLDYAERFMLEQLVEKDMLDKIIEIKETGELGKEGTEENLSEAAIDASAPEMQKLYNDWIHQLRENNSMDDVNSLLGTIQEEKKEVLRILDEEGGDLDEVIARVRTETVEKQQQRDTALEQGEENKEDK